MAVGSSENVVVRGERMATGGEVVARFDDGQVVFVRGALPGELVRIHVEERKKRFARGQVIDVLEPAAARREPPCQHTLDRRCGGCDWSHIDPQAQHEFKQQLVIEQLTRLGGVEMPQVDLSSAGPGTRSTVRCAVTHGKAGYRARRSDQPFAAEACGAAHPLLEELIVDGRFGGASQVTLRVGVATGERVALTNGPVDQVEVPPDVVVAHIDAPGDAAYREHVRGVPFRVSAKSFFQTSHRGAEALVEAVRAALEQSNGAVVDLYGGVGLLGGAAVPDRLVCSVESNPWSSADARFNLDPSIAVEHSRVERWRPASLGTKIGAVIADPARRGLGRDGVHVINKTGATTLALVSCDPASLGRDTALLIEQGWCYDSGVVIDMFPDTSRIEVVSRFTRAG